MWRVQMQKCRLNFSSKMWFFLTLYIYVQLFHLNCIEKDLYIAIKVKLLERFKVIFIINTEINISKTTFVGINSNKKNTFASELFMYNLQF